MEWTSIAWGGNSQPSSFHEWMPCFQKYLEWFLWVAKSECQFFVLEIEQQGNGLRGVVYNAIIDSKISFGFHNRQIEEMFFHLHIEALHNNISQKKLSKCEIGYQLNRQATSGRDQRGERCNFQVFLLIKQQSHQWFRVFPLNEML